MTELYKKYRPKDLTDVVGHESVCKTLSQMLESQKVPHSLMFIGPSGTGKTTLARIMARRLGCGKVDFQEINCADTRGIETVRSIKNQMGLSPLRGSCKVWLLDEFQKATADAQTALLKPLEDTPGHVFFLICTTDPHKILKTIRNRCTEISLKLLTPGAIKTLVTKVATAEGLEGISGPTLEALTNAANGSPRKALVILDQIANLPLAERLKAIEAVDTERSAIEIARALINPRTTWGEMASILKAIEDDPEGLRHLVLAYCTSILLSGKADPRAAQIIGRFSVNYFDAGKAGLVVDCYHIICGGK